MNTEITKYNTPQSYPTHKHDIHSKEKNERKEGSEQNRGKLAA
jgi:5-deoxy-D-glucuronate isomerase